MLESEPISRKSVDSLSQRSLHRFMPSLRLQIPATSQESKITRLKSRQKCTGVVILTLLISQWCLTQLQHLQCLSHQSKWHHSDCNRVIVSNRWGTAQGRHPFHNRCARRGISSTRLKGNSCRSCLRLTVSLRLTLS